MAMPDYIHLAYVYMSFALGGIPINERRGVTARSLSLTDVIRCLMARHNTYVRHCCHDDSAYARVMIVCVRQQLVTTVCVVVL